MEHYTDLAFRYIKMKKSRSILTMLGVSVSVMLLYIILNLGWSYVLNDRAKLREDQDYEIVLLTENREQINEIMADKRVKDATVGKYYVYDYYDPVTYPNATYINTTNPYRMDNILTELTEKYGVSGRLNKELATTYLQGEEGEVMYVLILVYFMIAYIFAIFGVGIIRNSIQLTLFEQIKDFGNLRCIGSTRKQMEHVIFMQGLILEAAGIVCGVIMGWIGSIIAGYMIGWNNTGFHILPVVFVVAAFMFDLYFSMKENAKLVTGMSPVSAIRGEYRIHLEKKGRERKKSKKNELRKKNGKKYDSDEIENNIRESDVRNGNIIEGSEKISKNNIKKDKQKLRIDKKKSGGIFGKIFGIEGEYAYKNLMRAPGRFFKVVSAMTFGVAAAIILSCGALAVVRYDSKIQGMYGYYPVYVCWYMNMAGNWQDAKARIPYTKIGEEINKLSSVTEAKRVFVDGAYVADYDRDLHSHFTDKYIDYTEIDEYREKWQKEAADRLEKGENAMFYQSVLAEMNRVNVVGYDEQDIARCKDDIIEGTLDVSNNGIIVVENDYIYTHEHEDEYEGGAIRFEKLYNYNIGDTINLIDMAEYRKRVNEITSPVKKEHDEKLKSLSEQRDKAQRNGEDEVFQELQDEMDECDLEYNTFVRKCRIDIYDEMCEEGCYKTYTVEGILKNNPNGYTIADSPQIIVPVSHFHDTVGREKDFFTGMMYHFEPFTLRQYEQVDWMGIEEMGESLGEDGNATFEYDGFYTSGYAEWENVKRDLRNGLIAAALISMFLVAMIMINYINNTASNIYMRRKEFAQLRVIGVSKRGLFNMVMLEGIIASIISCVLGVMLGAGISYGLIMLIFVYFKDVEFVFPWIPAIISVIISAVILCGAVYVPLKRMPNDVAADLATAGE